MEIASKRVSIVGLVLLDTIVTFVSTGRLFANLRFYFILFLDTSEEMYFLASNLQDWTILHDSPDSGGNFL